MRSPSNHFINLANQYLMNKLLLPLICFIISSLVSSAQDLNGRASIKTETDLIFTKLVEIRRDLHEHPELAGYEIRTQKLIVQHLLGLGLEVDTNGYGHGVVGILRGGKKGKSIAWRSDMDALPQEFPDPVSFKSQVKGVQHGCGHDLHMAIGLGIAEVLAKRRTSLKGTVYFIFQPEEETFTGAKGMLKDGLLSKINLEEIYGLHVTALPVGQIMVKADEPFAYQKRIRVTLKDGISNDQAKALSKKIYSTLSRALQGSKPWEIQNISDPKIGLMNPNTIFKDYLIMDEHFSIRSKNNQLLLEAYIYETDSSRVKDIIPKIKQVVTENGYAEQLVTVSFSQENPTVLNNKQLTAFSVKSLTRKFGKSVMVNDYGQVPYFNDDFAYFQQKTPGVYFFLGGSNVAKGIVAMNHAPNFAVDEECIRTGVQCFSLLIMDR